MELYMINCLFLSYFTVVNSGAFHRDMQQDFHVDNYEDYEEDYNYSIFHEEDNHGHDDEHLNVHEDSDRVTKDCGESSFCVPLNYCEKFCEVIEDIDTDLKVRHEVLSHHCGFLHNTPLICCPGLHQAPKSPVCHMTRIQTRTSQEFCGTQTLVGHRIVNGESSPPGEWPWMSALGYLKVKGRGEDPGDVEWRCSGSLLANRWVITAGHCLNTVDHRLVEVRVGDTDLSREYDCLDEGEDGCQDVEGEQCFQQDRCAPPHQSFKPVKMILHPEFRKEGKIHLNDYGLIKLDRLVEFSDFVLPVCLPDWSSRREMNSGIVMGWGNINEAHLKFESATKLQHLFINLLEKKECNRLWSGLGIQLQGNQRCASSGQQKMAVCNGDSGGPLVVQEEHVFVLEAIVSFGLSNCGNTFPSVFSEINEDIVEWIKRVIGEPLPQRLQLKF